MIPSDLFDESNDGTRYLPLASRMRPEKLGDYAGQQHILGKDKLLYQSISSGQLHSMIFWGPPGVGKTTLAKVMALYADAQFIELSAVLSGVKDIRVAVDKAKQYRAQHHKTTLLFVDEVHRFNKSQQDAFLPHIENGDFVFVGATTENPSFELNSALLSRCRVYVLKSLNDDDIRQLLERALQIDTILQPMDLTIEPSALDMIVQSADGDARRALNLLELAVDLVDDQNIIMASHLKDVLKQSYRRFDKGGDLFYDQISAMHKSIRGSNPDAALYWLCRMLDGGCDPLYLARRVIRTASEDIGNADPRALQLAMNAWQVLERLGSPEGELALAQSVIYLACAAKSNAVYTAFNDTMKTIKSTGNQEVPLHLRNAPTDLMKSLDYSKLYRYPHDEPDAFAAGEVYLPEALADEVFYKPTDRGLEKQIRQKLEKLSELNSRSMIPSQGSELDPDN